MGGSVGHSISITIPLRGHVDFEGRARLNANFLAQMTDPANGQPYFRVHDCAPAQAVHDWLDFVDLAARYLEAAFLVRDMTGDAPAGMDALREGLVRTFEPDTGLFYRPRGAVSTHCADLFDQTRALAALCTWIMAADEDRPRRLAREMLEGLLAASRREGKACVFKDGLRGHRASIDVDPGYEAGPMIRPLVKLAELLDDERALDLAAGVTRFIVEETDIFAEDGAFASHTHSRLATAAGIHAAGTATGNSAWRELAYRAYRYIRDLGTSFGMIPEFAGGEQPAMTCETCALMDYADLMLLLARDGRGELWDEVDRLLHNHLIESQFVSADWGRPGRPRPRTEHYLEDDVPTRMLGGFAGWAAATRMFGMTHLPRPGSDWFTPTADQSMYLGRPFMAQNCCGSSGLKALHLVWSHAIETRDDTVFVHLAINRAVPGFRVEAPLPGEVCFFTENGGRVAFRLPEGVDATGLRVQGALSHAVRDGYLRLEPAASRETRVFFDPPRVTRTDRIRHASYPDEIITSRCVGPAAIDITTEGGPTDEQWRELSTLWGKAPLYRDREASPRTPEPSPTCRVADVSW